MAIGSPTSQIEAATRATEVRKELLRLFNEHPLPTEELLVNLGLFIRSGSLARLLFLDEIYQKILPIPGILCEFGVWWGQTLTVFENLRAVYEPYNYTRRIVGFDTFEGMKNITAADTRSGRISEGVYGVPSDYMTFLDELLSYHQQENPMAHINKHELVKGDATATTGNWFGTHPEVLVALAFFDMALYEPTRAALLAIKPRLIKGSVVVFDQLCNRDYPGETRAALEILGAADFEIERSRYLPDRTIFVRR